MQCPTCNGSGLVSASSQNEAGDKESDLQDKSSASDSQVKCPTCKGHGRIPWYNFPIW
jgi:RecJ-like exonuclease